MARIGIMAVASLAFLVATGPRLFPTDKQPAQRLTTEQRIDLVRGLQSEFVFVRRTFPMGMKGLTLKDGKISPDESGIHNAVAANGVAARPGDRAQITNVVIRDKSIVFELNGGPKKKTKWYQHVSVGMGGMEAPISQAPDAMARGSVLTLEFNGAIPGITADQVKKMLEPVFDFSGHSAAELFVKQFPPEVQSALKDHKVLVGMDKELVTDAKGRPDQRLHEKDANGDPYEEWIYGTPPQEVMFVRFHGDEVSQVEIMQVDGQKIVRTEKEIDLKALAQAHRQEEQKAGEQPGGAVASSPPADASQIPEEAKGPKGRPTLRRPGEPEQDPATTISNPGIPRNPTGPTSPPGQTPPTACPNPPCPCVF
ncbi:MAG: hypothetical protein JO041_04935 [Acidobacteria bacterium]|nr:hypothetical protein [Acidobacteriota bacterium]